MLNLEERASVDFGMTGNDEPHLVEGWANAEPGFRWSLGDRSRLVMEFAGGPLYDRGGPPVRGPMARVRDHASLCSG